MGDFFDDYLWWLPFGQVPEVSAEDLKREISKTRKRPHLLDVRTDGEWRQGAIKGTVLVPISILRSQINALPFDRKEPIVAICRSAHRSIPAVRLLRKAGFENVRQLKGGMMAWQRLNYPTVNPRDS
jgi:rhodanese-related sulfurtransferase